MARTRFVYHPEYVSPLGGHVFPIEKFELAHDRLLASGATAPGDWIEPEPASDDELALVHTRAYLDDFFACRWTERTMPSELPLDEPVVRAFTLMAGGTIAACRAALECGSAMNVGGGFHHAFPEHAEGFCYLNDLAIGIRVAQRDGGIRTAAVIDCDLHQGNGTARIFQDDDTVFTFSMHQEHLYPIKEESDWDIGLPDPAGDELYLDALRRAVPIILERERPDLVVYQAGADPYEEDQLGNLGISMAALAERDRIVLEAAAARGIPFVGTFGGGYAREVEDTVSIHVNTCLAAIAAGAHSSIGARP